MKTEQIEVLMSDDEYREMVQFRKYKGRKVFRWIVSAEEHDPFVLNYKRMVRLEVEVVEPKTDEVVTISPTAANEIHLELIKMRNQFEESAKKITLLLGG